MTEHCEFPVRDRRRDQPIPAERGRRRDLAAEVAEAAAEATAEIAPVLAEIAERMRANGQFREPAHGEAWLATDWRSSL